MIHHATTYAPLVFLCGLVALVVWDAVRSLRRVREDEDHG